MQTAIGKATSGNYTLRAGYLYTVDADTRIMPDISGANVWYVNNGSTSGDVYCSAIGDTANDGLSPATPKFYLSQVDELLTAGDTVYVDAGTYYEPGTVTVPCSAVWVIGKDSGSTVIDFAGGARSLAASNVTDLTIRKLAVTNGLYGIYFTNVDSSVISSVRADSHTQAGIRLISGSTDNTLFGNRCSGNAYHGIRISGSTGNLITGNTSENPGGVSHGLCFDAGSPGNVVTNNVFKDNFGHGVSVEAASNNTQITGNIFSGNACMGIYLWNSSGNVVRYNNFINSPANEMVNVNHSAVHLSSALNSVVEQNTIDSTAWGVYIGLGSGNSVFHKNGFTNSDQYPDSGLVSIATAPFDLTRNWWGTTDSAVIRAKMSGAGAGYILYTPFRLGNCDTTIGADTVAPAAPVTVTVTGTSASSCTIGWSAATTNEEIGGVLTDLAGYRVYRSTTADTNWWAPVGTTAAGVTSYTDATISVGPTYYYRVTAYDDHAPWPNESWYSDSLAAARLVSDSPTISAFTVAGGALAVRQLTVTIAIAAAAGTGDVQQMIISRNADFSGDTWAAYQSSTEKALPDSDGVVVYYARVSDSAGVVSAVALDTVILDRGTPVIELLTETRSFAGAMAVLQGLVTDSYGVGDTVMVSCNGTQVFNVTAGNFTCTVSLTIGGNAFQVTGYDAAGNSATYSCTLVRAAVVIAADSSDTSVNVPADTGSGGVVVVLPTNDTYIIAMPVLHTSGDFFGDSWYVELSTRDSGVSFTAAQYAPDSCNTGTEQLDRWDDFKYSIFEFTLLSDTGANIGGDSGSFRGLWATFHVSPTVLAGLSSAERAHLNMFWFNENSRKWVPLGGTQVDVNAGTIRARLEHFSIYGIFSGLGFADVKTNLNDVTVYPNPYIPDDGDPGNGIPFGSMGDGSGIYMNRLVPGTKIRVYDIRGRLVEEMVVPAGTGAVQWDVRNRRGEDVASGVYIVTFENGGEHATRKIIVVR